MHNVDHDTAMVIVMRLLQLQDDNDDTVMIVSLCHEDNVI